MDCDLQNPEEKYKYWLGLLRDNILTGSMDQRQYQQIVMKLFGPSKSYPLFDFEHLLMQLLRQVI